MRRLYSAVFNQHYQKVVIKLIYPYRMSYCLTTAVCGAKQHAQEEEREFCCSWDLFGSCVVYSRPLKEQQFQRLA